MVAISYTEDGGRVPIYKYFTEEAHALRFINDGQMMWKPLSFFRVIEDEEVRGDANDGILIHTHDGGLVLNKENGEQVILENGFFTSSVKADDIFVFCASKDLSEGIAQRFNSPFCVEVVDIDLLAARLRARACPTSKVDYAQLVSGDMQYRPPLQPAEADWALPEKVVFIKPELFGWQNEFRIALPKRGAFDVHNVELTIQIGEFPPPPAPTQKPIFIEVGNLEAITNLHKF